MPLLWVSVAFLAGLCLPLFFSLHWGMWAGLSGFFLAASFLEKKFQQPEWLAAFRRSSRVTVCLLLAAIFAGAARYQQQQPVFTQADLAYYNDTEVTLVGQVIDYPDVRDNAIQLTIEAIEVQPDESQVSIPVNGKVLVRLATGRNWQYGDMVRMEGKLATPSENDEFSYRDYLSISSIYSTMYYPYAHRIEHSSGNRLLGAIFKLREYANQTIQQIMPQPEAGLLSGILLGLEHDIPDNLDQAFKDTGTTHIIAISGFNIAILAGIFFGGASRVLPRMWAPLFSIVAIALYTVMVGAQASVVRAAIMGSMALIGRQIGRQGVGINSLAFTAAVMCAFNPFLLRDVGFQLSFMATLGLVLYADPLHDWLESKLELLFPKEKARRLAGPISEYFLFTLAAQVTTLPLIIYHFGRFSISSFLANVLILPVQPLVMILGGVGMMAGMFWLPLGKLLGGLAWVLPAYTDRMVTWLAKIPGGSIELGESSIGLLLAFYTILFALTLHTGLRKYFTSLPDLAKKIKPTVILVTMTLICVFAWRCLATLPDDKLHITVMNVPDGPAVLIQSPEGMSILIDGGSSASRLSSELGQRLSMMNRRLDALLVTDVKSKPLAGLPVSMERFPPDLVLWNTDAAALKNGKLLAETLSELSVNPNWLESGQTLDTGDGTRLRVLEHNTKGTALLVEYDRFVMLIPGGISPEKLMEDGIQKADVILLSEADLLANTADEWEEFLPVLVVWSGADNPQVPVDNPRWVHVDELNAVEVITDGQTMWAKEAE